MTATLTTKQIKDGAGTIFLQRVLDTSGTGAGPFLPLAGITDPDGAGPIDFAALIGAVVAALGGPLQTRDIGANFAASGLTAVTGSIAAAGTTAGLAVKAGRTAYLWLSGGTSAAGSFEYSNDAGATWFKLAVEGSQIGTFSHVASGGNQAVVVPVLDQASIQVRARFTAVSGTVSYTLSQ